MRGCSNQRTGTVVGHGFDGIDPGLQPLPRVDVAARCSVTRRAFPGVQAAVRGTESLADMVEGIHHRVADELHARAAKSLRAEVGDARFFRHEMEGRKPIDGHTIALLRHRGIPAAKARFDMRHGDATCVRRLGRGA